MATTKRRRKRADKAQRRTLQFLGVFGGIVGSCTLVAFIALCVATSWLTDLPDYSKISTYANSGITTIYASDRTTVLGKIYLENRIQVSSDEVSQYVFDATVATEDERFYSHNGVDAESVIRALVVNVISGGTSEGASTITQQLVRNTVLVDEMSTQTLERKVREMYIAIQVEKIYSKDEILMMYLNVVNYGDGCYGIEAASQNYFGKPASELTLSEAALLVAIPQSPTANNPREHMDNAMARRAVVLQRMLSNGYITREEYDATINEAPVLAEKSDYDDDVSNIAPYFVDYVKQLINDSDSFSASEVSRGGLSIYTTLDVDAQIAANEAVTEGLKGYNDEIDASLVCIEPSTGSIVAMVGGKDYDSDQYNLATQMSRQAGSSFKTFTLLAALSEGIDPDSTYIDSSSPITIGSGESSWSVSNSEGQSSGMMSITRATTRSVNTVYARLCHAIGAQKVVDMAQACGITSGLEAYDSIALGAQGVNTLEMASAYATIANGGIYHEPVAITQVFNSSGDVIYTHTYDEGTRAISESVAQKATEILETVIEYGTGTYAAMDNDQPCAGKTGTSENGRDLWFCGYTPQYSTAVWMGFRTERETSLYGGSACGPIWSSFMETILDGAEVEEFSTADEEIEYKDDSAWDFDEDVTVVYSSYSSSSSSSSSSSYSKSQGQSQDGSYTETATTNTGETESSAGTGTGGGGDTGEYEGDSGDTGESADGTAPG